VQEQSTSSSTNRHEEVQGQLNDHQNARKRRFTLIGRSGPQDIQFIGVRKMHFALCSKLKVVVVAAVKWRKGGGGGIQWWLLRKERKKECRLYPNTGASCF
jgi:hypothetical protein